ncbi:hypothetical protein GW17_00054609 [Ensete ventricosum]|nr:hypothetical protein GW17_00054609 [Ensete ventricosum]
MGGALSIASGVLVPEADAVVAFYGVPPPELADPSLAKAPIQAHFGELDNILLSQVLNGCTLPIVFLVLKKQKVILFPFLFFFFRQAAKALEEKLKSSGVPYEVYIYPRSGHAFMNASPDGIKRRKEMGMTDEDPAAVELAWSRFSSWMGRYLLSP